MSKMQDRFLAKVSKGIKKSIFEDEPDVSSGSLIIDRLQSLAGAQPPGRSMKAVDNKPGIASTDNAKTPPVAAPTTSTSVDPEYRSAKFAVEPAAPLDGNQDGPLTEKLPASGNSEPLRTSKPLATILVVEDEIVTQRLTRKILEERGYEVIVVSDGVEALMTLGKMNFDLILCDINMPNMDGFKLMEYLNQKNIFIPVIYITVREDMEDEIRGLALGAKDYIRKPVNRDLLLLRIRKALDK
jgi:CheY-like chemotaxis protein